MPTRWKFILQYKQVTCIGGWVSTFKIFLRPSNSDKKWRSRKQKEIDVQNILRTRDGFLLLKRTVLYNYYLRIHSRILSITYETFLVNISNRNRSETDRFQSHTLCGFGALLSICKETNTPQNAHTPGIKLNVHENVFHRCSMNLTSQSLTNFCKVLDNVAILRMQWLGFISRLISQFNSMFIFFVCSTYKYLQHIYQVYVLYPILANLYTFALIPYFI